MKDLTQESSRATPAVRPSTPSYYSGNYSFWQWQKRTFFYIF